MRKLLITRFDKVNRLKDGKYYIEAIVIKPLKQFMLKKLQIIFEEIK